MKTVHWQLAAHFGKANVYPWKYIVYLPHPCRKYVPNVCKESVTCYLKARLQCDFWCNFCRTSQCNFCHAQVSLLHRVCKLTVISVQFLCSLSPTKIACVNGPSWPFTHAIFDATFVALFSAFLVALNLHHYTLKIRLHMWFLSHSPMQLLSQCKLAAISVRFEYMWTACVDTRSWAFKVHSASVILFTHVELTQELHGIWKLMLVRLIPFSTTDKVSHRQHTEDLEVLERKLTKRIDDKVL